MELSKIINGCKNNERTAQNKLYKLYASLFYSIALRYMKAPEEAEDVLVQGFFKIFNNVDRFQNKGSFEGWMKRIIVNEALMALRKHKNMALTVSVDDIEPHTVIDVSHDPLEYEELINLLNELPTGYRTVFNLYAIEGYKHREIAELLGISINTSKSQLILARRKLQQLIKKKVKFRTA